MPYIFYSLLKQKYFRAQVRILDDWIFNIEHNKKPFLHAKIAGNICNAGIAASKSARSGGKSVKIKIFTE